MKNQLQSELKQLAETILVNSDTTDTFQLKQQAATLYEKLCVLAYAEEQENSIIEETQTESIPERNTISPLESKEEAQQTYSELASTPNEEIATPDIPEIEEQTSTPDLLNELEALTAGFENMPEFDPVVTLNSLKEQKSSLNNSLKKSIQFGLNDRLAFVNQLFNGSQDDFTRVLSQLNTLETSDETNAFINTMVKPEYNNWQGKEAFEERFLEIVFRKFDGA